MPYYKTIPQREATKVAYTSQQTAPHVVNDLGSPGELGMAILHAQQDV
jgi:hypothetical protein